MAGLQFTDPKFTTAWAAGDKAATYSDPSNVGVPINTWTGPLASEAAAYWQGYSGTDLPDWYSDALRAQDEYSSWVSEKQRADEARAYSAAHPTPSDAQQRAWNKYVLDAGVSQPRFDPGTGLQVDEVYNTSWPVPPGTGDNGGDTQWGFISPDWHYPGSLTPEIITQARREQAPPPSGISKALGGLYSSILPFIPVAGAASSTGAAFREGDPFGVGLGIAGMAAGPAIGGAVDVYGLPAIGPFPGVDPSSVTAAQPWNAAAGAVIPPTPAVPIGSTGTGYLEAANIGAVGQAPGGYLLTSTGGTSAIPAALTASTPTGLGASAVPLAGSALTTGTTAQATPWWMSLVQAGVAGALAGGVGAAFNTLSGGGGPSTTAPPGPNDPTANLQAELLNDLIAFQREQAEAAKPFNELNRLFLEQQAKLLPNQLALEEAAAKRAEALLPLEQRLAQLQIEHIERGGRATPEQEVLINNMLTQQLEQGTRDITFNRQRQLEQLPDIATARGLRSVNPRTGAPGDTPIEGLAAEIAANSLGQYGNMISGLESTAANAKLNFPLFGAQLITGQTGQQQNIAQAARDFQNSLQQSAFNQRLSMGVSPFGQAGSLIGARPIGFDYANLISSANVQSANLNAQRRSQNLGLTQSIFGGLGSLALGGAMAFR